MKWRGKDEDRAAAIRRYVREGQISVPAGQDHLGTATGDLGEQRDRPSAQEGRSRGADSGQAGGDQRVSNAAPVVTRAYGVIQELASLGDGDIRNLGLNPADVQRLSAWF